jgi:hypothetical protein
VEGDGLAGLGKGASLRRLLTQRQSDGLRDDVVAQVVDDVGGRLVLQGRPAS